LKEVVPRVSRVAVLWDEANRAGEFNVKETEAAVVSVGLTLHVFPVRGPNEFSGSFSAMVGSFSAMVNDRVGAVIVGPSAMFVGQRRRLADLAARSRLPAVFTAGEYPQAGGLMSYGPHLPDLYRRAASFVDKILKGAKPADLPVELPTRFEVVVNLKTARALGLTIPSSVLARADEIIR
jgi:putative ABC transport system substrate-binding protein